MQLAEEVAKSLEEECLEMELHCNPSEINVNQEPNLTEPYFVPIFGQVGLRPRSVRTHDTPRRSEGFSAVCVENLRLAIRLVFEFSVFDTKKESHWKISFLFFLRSRILWYPQ